MDRQKVMCSELRMFWITSSDIHAAIRVGSDDVGCMLDELLTLVDMSDWLQLRERAAALHASVSARPAAVFLETGTGQ